MNLISLLGPHFSHNSQARGADYSSAGRVRILDRSDSLVFAIVRGKEPYEVHFSTDKEDLVLSCTCPHFEDGNPCKHIWATALRIVAEPSLGSWHDMAPRAIVFEFPEFGDLEDVDDVDVVDGIGPSPNRQTDRQFGAVRTFGARRPFPGVVRKDTSRPPAAPWQLALDRLGSDLDRDPDVSGAAVSGPGDSLAGEVLYVVDGEASQRHRKPDARGAGAAAGVRH